MSLSRAFFSSRTQPSTSTYLIWRFSSDISSLLPSFQDSSVILCAIKRKSWNPTYTYAHTSTQSYEELFLKLKAKNVVCVILCMILWKRNFFFKRWCSLYHKLWLVALLVIYMLLIRQCSYILMWIWIVHQSSPSRGTSKRSSVPWKSSRFPIMLITWEAYL